ncbi:hypothetical protein EG328_004331 [Venturia inaequalis]|uniref:Uncharacterized protein n=1 Tax=Venturia inaequalis TaxID=5025 RepID=A0A8H3VBT2_VENIN|nr:hypothetical protein EG327_004836 [Venturia inaequalis]KAE9986889.1 hypothetical protein EG328_004331 [Venturia inaequalis]
MAEFIAALDKRRQYLLRHLYPGNVSTINETMAVNTTTIPMNTSADLSLKLTILCLLTTLGGYVADPVIIERLLHPARFYNSDPTDLISNLQLTTITSLGCSMLGILVHCFQVFRLHGLLDPKNSPKNKSTHTSNFAFGNTLGTSFYPAHHALSRTQSNRAVAGVGNGFWARVLELIPHSKVHAKFDYEMVEQNRLKLCGIHKFDQEKHIGNWDEKNRGPKPQVVSEQKSLLKWFDDITSTEVPAIVLVFYYGFIATRVSGYFTFFLAMMYPFAVKIFFAIISVDRKTFHVLNAESFANNTAIFELDFGGSRLSSIEGEHALVHRFFEYYGQPTRNISLERTIMVSLAVCLGPLPFIVAFFALKTDYAYIWLAHQAFVMFGWFLARILNLNSCGRTEERIANALYKGTRVIFVNADGSSAIDVILLTSFVAPKPATAPTLISARPLVPIAEETENDAAESTSSGDSSANAVSTALETPPESVAGSEVSDADAESQPPGLQAPTFPAALLRLPNSACKFHFPQISVPMY